MAYRLRRSAIISARRSCTFLPAPIAIPPVSSLAETRIATAFWVRLPVLFPKQLLGHIRMLLALAMKLSKVGHGQYRRATARRSAEQRGLNPVILPLRPQGPCDLGSFGPPQVLVSCRGQSSNCGRSAATPGPLQTSIEEPL